MAVRLFGMLLAVFLLALLPGMALPAAVPAEANGTCPGKIVFSSESGSGEAIFIMNPDGSGLEQLTNGGSDLQPKLSLDGSQIVYVSLVSDRYQICRINVDGTGHVRLTDSTVHNLYPVWSPDGTRIAFVSQGDIWIMDASDGGNSVEVADFSYDALHLDWSVNDEIAFQIQNSSTGKIDLCYVNASAVLETSPHLLIGGDAYYNYVFPAWSPGGDRIAFIRYPDYEIFTAGFDGTSVSEPVGVIAIASTCENPTWSPDGNYIAYASDKNIYSITAAGIGEPALLNASGNNSGPHWGPEYVPPGEDTCTLTYIAGTGGSISGETRQTVSHGSDGAPVTAEPDSGYYFVDWSDGVATASRTDASVTADITVTAAFNADVTETTVTVNAPAYVIPDSDFTAGIDIANVSDLTAANYTVTFDPAVLRLDNVTAGSIEGTDVPVGAYNESPDGTLNIVQSLPMSGGISSVSGGGTLAVLHFHVLGTSGNSSQITLSEGCLANNGAGEIPAIWQGNSVEVDKVGQTIDFGPLNDKEWGDAPFAISAAASSGLPVTFIVVSGPADIDGNTVTLTGTGTVVIRASQAGDDYYYAAEDVERSFNISLKAGDVDGDGSVDALDITCLERIIVKLEAATPGADVNGDSRVDALDIVSLMQIILNQDLT